MKKFRTLILWTASAGLLLAAVDLFLLRPEHPHTWWQKIPAFMLLLGLVGGVLQMFSAKFLGKWWLYRDENYYDD